MKQHLDKLLLVLSGSLSALALFVIMALTFLDVIGRKAWSQSIPGAFEATEMLMVLVIFAALPLVSQRGEHVVFDSLDSLLPAWMHKLQLALMHILCAAALLGMAYLLYKAGGQFVENGETSAQLKIPKAPFIYGMGFFCALTALVHLALAWIGKEPELTEGEGVAL